jgi:malate dehydrogenase
MAKVAILGAGMVGTATATYLAERNLADLVLIDVIDRGLAEGKAVDLAAASAVRGFSVRIEGTDEVEAAAGADVIVSTAGVPRKPGMDRMDLLRQNGEIARRLGGAVARHAPGAVFINVANPLDVLCHIFLDTMKFPRERVFGMAGVLDSTRFRTFLAGALDCDPRDVSAMVLGGHGDTMVPLVRTATVSGVPVTELLDSETLAGIVERTRRAGAEVVRLLRTGSAFLSTGAAVAQMVEGVLAGRPRLLPVSARLEGEYGMRGFHLGVPALIGPGGIRRIVEVELTEEERTALAASAEEVRTGIREWEGAGA